MAKTLQVGQITVTEVGKWGPRVGDEWYSLDKQSKLTPHHFQPNLTYQIAFAVSETGKKYIHEIQGLVQPSIPAVVTPPPVAAAPTAPTLVPPVPQPTTGVRKPIDNDTNRRILLQGAIQAALHSPAGVAFSASAVEYQAWLTNTADYVVEYVESRLGKK